MLEKEPYLNTQIPYGMQMSSATGVPMQAGVDSETIKQSVDNSYISKRVKQSEVNSNLLPAATLATWYGISQGMDVFNKKCNVDYANSPLGKFGALGDKLTAKIQNSAFAKSNFGQWLSRTYTSTTTTINNLLNRSAMVRAFKHTPSEPTNKFVVPQAKGLLGWVSQDTDQIFSAFLKSAKTPFQLEQYGADKQFINNLKQAMKAPGADKYALLKEAEMKLLGVAQSDIDKYIQGGKVTSAKRVEAILRNKKIEKLGFASRAEYKKVAKDFLKNSDKVLNALEKAANNNGNMFISRLRSDGLLGKVQNHLFGRKVGFKELYNKYQTTLGSQNLKHTSKLGRMMAKGLGLFMEGTTNRFAGGKFAVLMQAVIFGDMIVNTLKAPKGEKGKTFAERFTNDFAYFLCAPFGLQLFHKLGGLQYTGMSKDEVAQYRADLKNFNKRVMAGQLSRKGDYINEKEALLGRLRGGRKNIFSKILGRVAEIADVGLEQLRPYHSKAVKPGILGAIKDFFTHPKYYWKNIAGYPMRIFLIMGMIMPPLATAATKVAHVIFGRPTNSVLDDEVENPEEAQQKQLDAMLEQLEAEKQAQANQQPVIHNSPTNLINQYMDKQTQQAVAEAQKIAVEQQGSIQQPQTNQPTTVQQPKDTYTYVPSPMSTVANTNSPINNPTSTDTATTNSAEPTRTYIPAPNGFVQGPIDTSKADEALRNADAAERFAKQTLSLG